MKGQIRWLMSQEEKEKKVKKKIRRKKQNEVDSKAQLRRNWKM